MKVRKSDSKNAPAYPSRRQFFALGAAAFGLSALASGVQAGDKPRLAGVPIKVATNATIKTNAALTEKSVSLKGDVREAPVAPLLGVMAPVPPPASTNSVAPGPAVAPTNAPVSLPGKTPGEMPAKAQ
jgi:hypothetical protein